MNRRIWGMLKSWKEEYEGGKSYVAKATVLCADELAKELRNENKTQREIIGELCRALMLLGAKSDLLGTVGSWGDSLPESFVLADLRSWNEATEQELLGVPPKEPAQKASDD